MQDVRMHVKYIADVGQNSISSGNRTRTRSLDGKCRKHAGCGEICAFCCNSMRRRTQRRCRYARQEPNKCVSYVYIRMRICINGHMTYVLIIHIGTCNPNSSIYRERERESDRVCVEVNRRCQAMFMKRGSKHAHGPPKQYKLALKAPFYECKNKNQGRSAKNMFIDFTYTNYYFNNVLFITDIL